MWGEHGGPPQAVIGGTIGGLTLELGLHGLAEKAFTSHILRCVEGKNPCESLWMTQVRELEAEIDELQQQFRG